MKLCFVKMKCFVLFIFNISHVIANLDLINIFLKFHCLTDLKLFTCESLHESLSSLKVFNENGIKGLLCNKNNVSSCFYDMDFNMGFVADDSCANFRNIMAEASKLRRFTGYHHWLILSKNPINATFWKEVNLGVDSEVMFVNTRNQTSNQSMFLTDIYNTGYENNGTLIVTDFGTWSKEDGIKKYTSQSKITERSDLKGLLIRTSAIVVHEFKKEILSTYLRKPGDNDIITKSCIFVVYIMADMFNLRLNFRRLNRWAEWDPKTHSFEGQVGELQHSRVDIGGSGLYLRPERYPYYQTIGQISYQRSIIIFKQPTTTSYSTSSFLKPLALSVWRMTGVVLLLCVGTFLLATVYEYFMGHNKKDYRRQNLYSSLFDIVGIFCLQGIEKTPKISSKRLIIFTCLVFTYVLNQFYSASIVSSLLSEPTKVIKNTEDLLKSDLKFLIHDVRYHRIFFEISTIKIVRQFYEKKCYNGSNSVFVSLDEGIPLVMEGGYALYGDTDDLYSYLQHMNRASVCGLDEVYFISKEYLYSGARRGLPLINMVAVGIRRLHERGLVIKELALKRISKPAFIKEGVKTVPLGLPETRAAFLFLLWGYIAALLILILEIIYCRASFARMPFTL